MNAASRAVSTMGAKTPMSPASTRLLGLVGGTSWVSTLEYYRLINQGVNRCLGGVEFARLIIHSFNYGDMKRNNDAGLFDVTLRMVLSACENMKQGGAEAIVFCASTMHLTADPVTQHTGLPVIHIADATADQILQSGAETVALLGTKFTMQMDFFKAKLLARGIAVIVPTPDEQEFIHDSIGGELAKGLALPQTKERYLEIISRLAEEGAQGVVLGCTEMPLLIGPNDTGLEVFDTTKIHTDAVVAFTVSRVPQPCL